MMCIMLGADRNSPPASSTLSYNSISPQRHLVATSLTVPSTAKRVQCFTRHFQYSVRVLIILYFPIRTLKVRVNYYCLLLLFLCM